MEESENEPTFRGINDVTPFSKIIAISSKKVDDMELVDVFVDFRGDGKLIEDPIENDQAFSKNLEDVKEELQEKGMSLELVTAPNGREFWVNEAFAPTVKAQFEDSNRLLNACLDID